GALLVGGMGMMIVGIGFKLALVPFHLWTPDVYEGAPAPVTALVATVSKGAMLFVLLRYSGHLGLITYRPLVLLLSAIAVLSMSFGNLLALRQSNVKRILAYSSIAHVGYFLVAFLAAGEIAATSIVYYLVSYIATTLGAFAVVALLSGNARDADGIDDYRGLAYRHPWIAGTFTLMILSLAGIPLTAGFMGKFYVAAAGVSAGLWLLVTALIVNSAVGIFYYLRIIAALYSRVQDEGYAHNEGDKIPFRYPGLFVLAAASLAVLGLGVYPSPLIALIQTAVAGGL
ncbi:MAG: NADH-quinone oxidoreductase subunit N, partial [Thermodesulfovibrionales bacterium]